MQELPLKESPIKSRSLMRIVLASESASRRRAMDILGLAYEVRPSRIDEKAIREEDPERLACRLSEAKARTVAETNPDAVIVAGDAVVSKAGRIYEKPADAAEAFEFLSGFSGDAVIRFADHVSGSYNFATGVALNDLISLLRVHGVEV